METVNWKVEGMTCSNCALTINKFLEKKGLQNIKLSLASGDLSFDLNGQTRLGDIEQGIRDLGYRVAKEPLSKEAVKKKTLNPHLRRLLFCLPFALALFAPMLNKVLPLHALMNPWIQLALCLPVYIIGMNFFGRSAIQSIRNGLPNMNVLIAIGASSAFVYSLAGTLMHLGEQYLFYETTAAIICFILLGNYLEDISVLSTQKALNSLVRSQKVMANMIAFDDQHREVLFPVDSSDLRSGDLILIKSGEQVPADAKILWGEASANEAILTGESLPLDKKAKDPLLGGSLLVSGTVKAQVTAAAKDSVLANIINLVRQVQGEKPPVQILADRISSIFVPVVLVLALLTFLGNLLLLHELTPSLMRSVAVLVIACPCAMGLATPAAIAVGLGRAARNGILFRHARGLELFKNIRQVVFDKTGTLTTGEFVISGWSLSEDLHARGQSLSEEEFKRIAYSIEKYSNHPMARAIALAWKSKNEIKWKQVEELKGLGMRATTADGDVYLAGSHKILTRQDSSATHNIYISRNDRILGWIDCKDEIRPEAHAIIRYLHSRKIRTILLSGDHESNCLPVASELEIGEVYAGQSPEQKLAKVASLTEAMPTAMVGDGINDAPALAKATIGISMSDATHAAMQTSDVVLMGRGLKNLPLSLGLGRETYHTIRQNLFWAFFYNIIAIPVAAWGLLTPAIGALAMGLSDVVLVGNSIRLYVKKIK